MSDSEYSDVEEAQPVRKLGQKGSGKTKKPKKPKASSSSSSSSSIDAAMAVAGDGVPKKKGLNKLLKIDPNYLEALSNSEEVDALDAVMQKGSVIKADIAKLESEIATVQTKINHLRISDTYEGADSLRDELRGAHGLASKIRKDLAELKDIKVEVPDSGRSFKPKHQESEGVVRMQRNLYLALSTQFQKALGEMTQVADSFQRIDKKPTDQYYKPGVGGGYDDEGGSSDDDAGGYGQQQKQKQLSATREAEERAQRAYIYSKEVNQELRELEESIVQLHQLFVDISAQTQAQGELLGISEEAVRQASEQSSKALQVLQAAEQHVNAARKKFLAAVLIIIGVIVLIIAGIGAAIAVFAMLG